MESRPRAQGGVSPPRPPQRLYLITPPVGDPASFAPALEGALAAGDIAAVLLRLADADERTLLNRAKAIAALVQRRDVALLLEDKPELVARAGADGAHLSAIEPFAAALSLLKPERIAGAGGLHSRHDAMLAAETGADYVMFGDPDLNHGRLGHRLGHRLRFDEVLERLTWWAELLEIPCVAYAASLDEVAPLAQTGADFIALGEWIWNEPQGAAAAIQAAAEILAAPAAQ
jgi:thiamine-phosphate pyrophosphorylase